MKRILLIGKFNEALNNLNKELSNHFVLQLCSDNLELLKGIMKMNKPDTILISAVGLDESHKEIFSYLTQSSKEIPVFCIGNKDELDFMHNDLEGGEIKKLNRTASVNDIITAVNENFGIPIKEFPQDNKTPGTGTNTKKTILLVDDAAVQLRTMEGMLKKDYNVKLAISGKEAIDILKKSRPDLILLDYNMPECDGKETFELIQKEENGQNLPVVFVTGVNEKKQIMEVLGLGPAGYLIKPVKREKLLEIVQQVLGK